MLKNKYPTAAKRLQITYIVISLHCCIFNLMISNLALTNSLTHSYTHLLTDSLAHLLTHSLICRHNSLKNLTKLENPKLILRPSSYAPRRQQPENFFEEYLANNNNKSKPSSFLHWYLCEPGENLLLGTRKKKIRAILLAEAKQEQFCYGFICHPQV